MKNGCLSSILLLISVLAMAQPVSFTPYNFGIGSYNSCTVDMNGDHLDDIVTVQLNQLTVYKQQATGGFIPTTYSLPGLGFGNLSPDWSIAAADFDRNGFTDLVFGNANRVSVLKADATGDTYLITTYPQNIFSQRTNFVDINNDGELDLFACHDVAQSHSYRNNGNSQLIFDPTLMPTMEVGGNYSSVWIDYDNDGDIDMYMAKCSAGAAPADPRRINLLYRNNGDGTFAEMAAAAGVNDNAQSWSTAFADYDNDGDLDFLLSNITEENKFFRNNGDGTFTDIFASTGIAPQLGSWEVLHADFNNDGFEDFLWKNSTELYLNNGNLTFTGYDLPFNDGSLADLNNDGFIDVLSDSNIYYNNGNSNKWLKVLLQGVESNRNGIGARIEIYGTWGVQIREIRSGEGFSVMSSLNAHFGIGNATAIEKVVVKWPSGTTDIIVNPGPNQSLFVLEGSSPLNMVSVTKTAFTLYPNPATEVLNVQPSTSAVQIESVVIYDIRGKVVLATRVNDRRIPVQKLESGTYLLLLKGTTGEYYVQRFIKE